MTTLRFRGDGHGDGTFRVLQMADVQDGPDVDPDTVALIEAKPDLVVFTGDQIRGYDPAWMRTFLRRRGERPGDHVREVTRFEAWWHRTFDGARLPDPPESEVPDDAVDALLDDARAYSVIYSRRNDRARAAHQFSEFFCCVHIRLLSTAG